MFFQKLRKCAQSKVYGANASPPSAKAALAKRLQPATCYGTFPVDMSTMSQSEVTSRWGLT
jgi:hypothetical protein